MNEVERINTFYEKAEHWLSAFLPYLIEFNYDGRFGYDLKFDLSNANMQLDYGKEVFDEMKKMGIMEFTVETPVAPHDNELGFVCYRHTRQMFLTLNIEINLMRHLINQKLIPKSFL